MRSSWKKVIRRNYKLPSMYFSKSYFFESKDVRKRIAIHNGSKLISFPVKKLMKNHFAGEFLFTKKMGAAIHITNKKKNKLFKWVILLTQMHFVMELLKIGVLVRQSY